jgi:XTP/dITP diphosphohydrolase
VPSPGSNSAGPPRLVLLATTHRVPAGVLAWPAWEALRTADRVVTREPDHPQIQYVEAAGVAVEAHAGRSDRELAALLVAAAARGSVVLLSGQDGDPGLGAALAAELATLASTAGGGPLPEVEVLPGSWDLPGARLLDLVAVMDRLRSPGGCPWDAAQTHASLVPYLLEEAYETVEAIEAGELVGLREELGDLLLQVVFHARIGQEHADEPWSVDDVAGGIVEKLVRRHPHVFADAHAPTAEHVEASWEVLKAAEKQRASVLDGVPMALPALLLTGKLLSRADKGGVAVEVAPVPAVLPPGTGADEDALGELLLALVAAARSSGVDAEAALRAAARRYATRVRAAETGAP